MGETVYSPEPCQGCFSLHPSCGDRCRRLSEFWTRGILDYKTSVCKPESLLTPFPWARRERWRGQGRVCIRGPCGPDSGWDGLWVLVLPPPPLQHETGGPGEHPISLLPPEARCPAALIGPTRSTISLLPKLGKHPQLHT